MNMLIPVIIVTLLMTALDLYVFKGISLASQSWHPGLRSSFQITYWLLNIIVHLALVYMIWTYPEWRERSPGSYTFFVSLWWVLFVPKLMMFGFHLIDDIGQVLRWGYKKTISPDYDIARRAFISKLGLGVAGVTFGSFLYGVTKGKFAFKVMEETVEFPDLPEAFEGLKIVQLSDAHLGSFGDNKEPIKKMVRMVNELEPDYIMFTGDMVNSHAKEAEGWEDLFGALKARSGKFSILGNHDYAKYFQGTEEEREDSMRRMEEVHQKMGFRLLRDESERIERNGSFLSILGVNNWGPGFGEYGDLQKAMVGVHEKDFKILLSHDPSHFEQKVMGQAPIHLTLSGHTHGCQMGIEIPSLGIKMSPVSIRYKRWGGLYKEKDQFLYVNRGMGVLGLPGRVGMPPEITQLTLTRANSTS